MAFLGALAGAGEKEQQMKERVTDLESRFMHHERTIQELSDIVYRQQQAIERHERELRQLRPEPAPDGGPLPHEKRGGRGATSPLLTPPGKKRNRAMCAPSEMRAGINPALFRWQTGRYANSGRDFSGHT